MRLSPRRFPHTITRIRRAPGSFNQFGEFEPGPLVETPLRANVQPLALTDTDIAGGLQLLDRIKCFVPTAANVIYEAEVMRWGADAFRWGADRFTFGRRVVSGGHGPALAAAFADRGADRVRIENAEYVVEESQPWPHYVRAILLRET